MKNLFTFLLCLTFSIGGLAAKGEGHLPMEREVFKVHDYPFETDQTPNDLMKGKVTLITKEGIVFKSEADYPTEIQSSQRKEEELFTLEINMPEAGRLSELLGENLESVESLIISGNINDDDFNTLWDAGYNGELVELDLGGAHMEGDSIPDYAMFHNEVQIDMEAGVIHCLGIRKLILPSNVTHIGGLAFAYFIRLVELGLPDSLTSIGKASFTDCVALKSDALSLPEGLEKIGYQAFYNCQSLGGEIDFPQSLKYLMGGTFYHCRLTKVTFPDTLECMGLFDFSGCRLTEVYIPDGCVLNPSGFQFYCNYGLRTAHLPDDSDIVPVGMFEGCYELEEVNIPSSVEYILEDAFDDTEVLTHVDFPEGLLSIGARAFLYCDFKQLDFPSTLTELGGACFGFCRSVSRISCRALVPPVCNKDLMIFKGFSPFGNYNKSTEGMPQDIPVYVPIGTKELYEQSWGWDYFTNFIETDFSSGFDELPAELNGADREGMIYDLQGKPVSTPQPGQIYIHDSKKELIH